MNRPVLRTELCDILGIEYPIMLAGMGVWGMGTPPELVAAAPATRSRTSSGRDSGTTPRAFCPWLTPVPTQADPSSSSR